MTVTNFQSLMRQLRIRSADSTGYELAIEMPITDEVVNGSGGLQGGLWPRWPILSPANSHCSAGIRT